MVCSPGHRSRPRPAPRPVTARESQRWRPTCWAAEHLPFERAAECLAEAFGAPVSTGWLSSLLPTAAAHLDGFLDLARGHLASAPVAHFDETGGRVNGRLHWIHVASTDRWTLLHLDTKRGRVAMDAAGVLPSFRGVEVHDGLGRLPPVRPSPPRAVQRPPPPGTRRHRRPHRPGMAHRPG
ncbi:MAG: transposase [Candidatus Nanopelagicales bacterium]